MEFPNFTTIFEIYGQCLEFEKVFGDKQTIYRILILYYKI